MPKIKQYSEKYAEIDFWREIQSRKALTGIKTDKELAGALGICPSGLTKRKEKTENLTVRDLRSLVRVLKPRPAVVLMVLGYSQKEIKGELSDQNAW